MRAGTVSAVRGIDERGRTPLFQRSDLMLVLSRKKQESILIGDCIRVTVLSVRGDKVQLGIEAPRNMQIYRNEVLEKIYLNQEVVCADGS